MMILLKLLLKKNVVALFQGKSEAGQRALEIDHYFLIQEFLMEKI